MVRSSPVERNLALDISLNSSVLHGESVIVEERNKQMIKNIHKNARETSSKIE